MGLSLGLNDYLYNTVLYASPIGIANLYIIEGFYALGEHHYEAFAGTFCSRTHHPGTSEVILQVRHSVWLLPHCSIVLREVSIQNLECQSCECSKAARQSDNQPMDASYSNEWHLQCNETECFGRILPATYRLSVPEVDTAADVVEIQSQEDECSEPAR